MKIKNSFIISVFCFLHGVSQAQIPVFSYGRKLNNIDSEGWYKIILNYTDFKVLQGDYESMRIYEIGEGDTTEVPYIIESREDNYYFEPELNNEEIPIDSFTIDEDRKYKCTIIYIFLEQEVPVNGFAFFVHSERENYYRDISIYSSPEREDDLYRRRYEYRYSMWDGILSSYDEGPVFFYPEKTKGLKVKIENKDDEPLIIDSIKLYTPVYELYVELEADKNYILMYGNLSLYEPEYDIVHFFYEDPEELLEVGLGDEISFQHNNITNEDNIVDESDKNQKLWIWFVMAGVIVVLGVFTLILIKGTVSENAPGT